MAEACGFTRARTLGASGNLLFDSDCGEMTAKHLLEERIETYFGKPVPVFVRSAEEMRAIADRDPFPEENGSRSMIFFLDVPPPSDVLDSVRGQQGERIALGIREIFVAYGDGIRKTKLVIPVTRNGTCRNRNTVQKLAALMEQSA